MADYEDARATGPRPRPLSKSSRRLGPPTVTRPLHELRVGLDELIPVKEAARSLPRHINRLAEVDQLVLTRRSKPCAVLVSVERYEALGGNAGRRARLDAALAVERKEDPRG